MKYHRNSSRKGLYLILLAGLALALISTIVYAGTDLSDRKDVTGTITVKSGQYILQSGKDKYILSLLPTAGQDSLDFHPAAGDTLQVKGFISKSALVATQAIWKGNTYAFRDSLDQPAWKGTGTHQSEHKKCIGCNLCVIFCPNNAITLQKIDGANKAVIDQAKCSDCDICITGNGAKFMGCPTKAITK